MRPHELLVLDSTFDLTTIVADSLAQAWDEMWDRIRRQIDAVSWRDKGPMSQLVVNEKLASRPCRA
jgi:hypothetical protein